SITFAKSASSFTTARPPLSFAAPKSSNQCSGLSMQWSTRCDPSGNFTRAFFTPAVSVSVTRTLPTKTPARDASLVGCPKTPTLFPENPTTPTCAFDVPITPLCASDVPTTPATGAVGPNVPDTPVTPLATNDWPLTPAPRNDVPRTPPPRNDAPWTP